MCEINPRHTKILRLEFFTSHPTMTREAFDTIIAEECLAMEMKANQDFRIRCHIHEEHPHAPIHAAVADEAYDSLQSTARWLHAWEQTEWGERKPDPMKLQEFVYRLAGRK